VRGFSSRWAAIIAVLFVLSLPVQAQQPAKIPRIGFLTTSPSVFPGRTEAFQKGLRELGYIEGKNVVIEWRYAEGKIDRLASLASELVRLKVDVILSGGPTATRFLKQATSTIPIVMGFDTDPIGNGLVAGLARPGGNITGLSVLSPELGGKRLELLTEIVPKLARVAVLGSSTLPGNAQTFRETELAAGALGVKLQHFDVLNPDDMEAAFQRAVKGRADAVLTLGNSFLNAHRKEIADRAIRSRLPAMYYASEFVESGGLMFYGVDFPDLFRRSAVYVDKILKGTKPADLPVEQPTKFELVINLKTASQIRLTIPANVLARADKVIR
jgi:putative ABC transport system substrate-binding protein